MKSVVVEPVVVQAQAAEEEEESEWQLRDQWARS